jgi:TolB protein
MPAPPSPRIRVTASHPSSATSAAAAAPATTRQLKVTEAARSLTRVTKDGVDEVTPALSPSGTVVLFETRVSSGGAITAQAIFGADPQTGGARTAYSSSTSKSGAPAWLPDGTYVFVSDVSGKPGIVHSLAAAPNAATGTVLAGEAAPEAAHPTCSPDGKRIAFEANLRGKVQIAVVGVDGSRLSVLGEGHRPSWSPDGKRIVLTRTVNDYSQLFVIGADGGGLIQVTSDPSDHDDPSWAPSSKLIVFNSNKGYDRQGGSWNLFAIKPDGTSLVQITEGTSDTGSPSWGNDGWIYFDSNQAGSYDIWRLRPAGDLDTLGNRR